MKRKSLLFAMMLCFAFFGVASAQQTLTVCNGTVEEQHIPIYAYSGDTQGTTSEFIIPESNLTQLNGKEITTLTFYLSQSQSKTWTANYQIYMAQVATTQLTRTIGPDAGTIVYEGTVDASGSEMTITFNQGNYTYNGGHLLIGTYVETKGAWDSNGKFYGIQATSAAYLSGSWGGYDDGAIDFIPKTTFTYLSDDPYINLTPTSATVLTGSTETLTATYGHVTGTPAISYTSSNTSVATVTSTGSTTATVTGESAGTATITATMTVNGTDYTATCTITVEDPSYCTPSYSNTSDYIKSFVTTGGTTNINNTNTGQGTGGYSDFYNSHSASIGDGETLSFTVTRGYDDSYKYAIWVDWNHDYVFDVNTETMVQQTTSVSSDWSSSFTIPVGTAAGDYRMRVEMLYGSSNTLNPCVSASYGEVEDYKLTIVASNPCSAPTNLQASQVGTTTAHLSWDGTNDSYVLQYRTAAHDNMNLWEQVGSDKAATATLTQYTYDLSDYSGTGNIAIRHYNVSDMFRLAIDDVVVTDARGQELVNEDFESGSIPSSWTNYDLDGDGNVWIAVSFDSQVGNGDYVAVSDSWNQSVGALTPDNWLIIPNVALGGTLTFYARGVDANYPQENFGVFVTNESLETVFANVPAGNWSADIPVSTTSYELTGLTANTPYEWQVKGICNGYPDPSNWASSTFTTIAEGFKTFITAGAWNVADNWFPVGVPTIEDEVSIEAAVTVPAGVVASAKRAVLNGGSILVKDGGQLKQGAATLNITMEKEITGYVDAETNPGNYYFIASPFGGRTQLAYNASWSHVLNVTSGEYDLYAFDPTQDLEWINYESQDSNNPHELFYEMSLQSGTGYLYANEADKTLTFTGTAWSSLNSSTTVDYTYNAESTDDFNGWKLVGNPYTCNGYISYVDAQGNALDADFYTLNLDNTYSLMSSNQPLPPCTGALMNVSATGKVQYSTEAPAKRASFLNMNVSRGNKTVSQARLRFGQGHNLGSMSFRNGSRLYMNVDGNDYAVVYTEKQGEMPVSFKADENGTYTLSFNNEEVSFSYLHLIDNMTGEDVDLLAGASTGSATYTFDARTSDYESRFRLVFATGSSTGSDTFGFVNASGNFCIFGIEGEATVQVIDVLGHVVSSETFSGSYERKINGAPGVYMIRLINGNDVKVQKVVVRR